MDKPFCDGCGKEIVAGKRLGDHGIRAKMPTSETSSINVRIKLKRDYYADICYSCGLLALKELVAKLERNL